MPMSLSARPHAVAAALLLSLAGASVQAETDGPIVTDRPDVSESSDVVGAGRFQIETSIEWARDGAGAAAVRERSFPTLLRIGLDKAWELRIETELHVRQRSALGSASGTPDTAVGLKWHVQDGDDDDFVPSVAALLHADLPTGSAGFKGSGVRPSLRVVGEWELGNGWSIGAMPGIASLSDDQGQRYTAGSLAVTLGKEFNADWRGYVEWSAEQWASRRHGGNVYSADAGVAWLWSPDVQLDASVTRGISRAATDWRWGLGLSVRY